MLDWRKEASELVKKMEDAFSAQRPISSVPEGYLGPLILGFIGAVVLMIMRQ